MQRPEEAIQRQLVNALRALARPQVTYWAVPNGGYRTKAEAGIMKATGTLAGVHDLHFISPGGIYRSLELKAPRGKLSQSQRIFGEAMVECGHDWAWADSLTGALEVLDGWGMLRSARL